MLEDFRANVLKGLIVTESIAVIGVHDTLKEDRLSGLALMHIHKKDVSLNSEAIVNDFAASGSRRVELFLGWPTVPLSQMATEKVAILTLGSHDPTLVKRRQFCEPFDMNIKAAPFEMSVA